MDNRDSSANRLPLAERFLVSKESLRKLFAFALGILGSGLFWVQDCQGQFSNLTPAVEQVRNSLNQLADGPEGRDARLKRAVQGLHTNRERREAFLLSEWRDQQTDLAISTVDQKYRQELAQVLLREYKAVLQSGEKAKIHLLLEKLPDFARQADESPLVANLVKELSGEITHLVKQGPAETRRMALITLVKTHADAELMLPLFTQLARDNQPELRLAAADGVDTLMNLQLSGNYAKGNNQPAHQRRESASAQTAKLVPLALQSLKDPQTHIRIMSSDSLRTSAILLSSLISDPNQSLAGVDPAELRRMIQTEWVELDPLFQAWAKALPSLGAGLVDRQPQVRLNCQRTLDELAAVRAKRQKQNEILGLELPDSLANPIRSVIPTLVEALRDPDIRVRRAAIDVLEALGVLAMTAAPSLQISLDDSDSFVRWAAIRALAAMGPDVLRQSKEKIQSMSNDPDPDVRRAVDTYTKRLGN